MNITIQLEDGVLKRVQEQAVREGKDVSCWIRDAVTERAAATASEASGEEQSDGDREYLRKAAVAWRYFEEGIPDNYVPFCREELYR